MDGDGFAGNHDHMQVIDIFQLLPNLRPSGPALPLQKAPNPNAIIKDDIEVDSPVVDDIKDDLDDEQEKEQRVPSDSGIGSSGKSDKNVSSDTIGKDILHMLNNQAKPDSIINPATQDHSKVQDWLDGNQDRSLSSISLEGISSEEESSGPDMSLPPWERNQFKAFDPAARRIPFPQFRKMQARLFPMPRFVDERREEVVVPLSLANLSAPPPNVLRKLMSPFHAVTFSLQATERRLRRLQELNRVFGCGDVDGIASCSVKKHKFQPPAILWETQMKMGLETRAEAEQKDQRRNA